MSKTPSALIERLMNFTNKNLFFCTSISSSYLECLRFMLFLRLMSFRRLLLTQAKEEMQFMLAGKVMHLEISRRESTEQKVRNILQVHLQETVSGGKRGLRAEKWRQHLELQIAQSYAKKETDGFYPRANGAKRRSGRKPGARVTNSAWLFTPG